MRTSEGFMMLKRREKDGLNILECSLAIPS